MSAAEHALRTARAILAALPESLLYHDVNHTFGIVLPAAIRYAEALGLDERTRELVRLGAAFHDTGFRDLYRGHEAVSADIAERELTVLGYEEGDVEQVRGMILATRLPQSPRTLAEQVVADADLDILGREEFLQYNKLLRRELALHGTVYDSEGWLAQQIAFVSGHSYFTAAANEARAEGKRANLAMLAALAGRQAERR